MMTLKEFRQAMGAMSMRACAERLGINLRSQWRVEHGAGCSLETAARIIVNSKGAVMLSDLLMDGDGVDALRTQLREFEVTPPGVEVGLDDPAWHDSAGTHGEPDEDEDEHEDVQPGHVEPFEHEHRQPIVDTEDADPIYDDVA